MTGSEAKELDYGIAMSINTLVTAMGMLSENMSRARNNLAQAYDDDAFQELINQNGTTHNGVLSRWEGVIQ